MQRSDTSGPAETTTLSPEDTVERIGSHAVLQWWQTTTIISVRGADAVTMLDGLCTQAVERIAPGTASHGLFLDSRAHIIAAAALHRPVVDDGAETTMLLATPIDRAEALVEHLSRYRLRARAAIETTDLATITVVGATAARVSEEHGDPGWFTAPAGRGPADAGPDRLAYVGAADDVHRLVNEVLPAAGIGWADPDAAESVRIDLGIPGLHDFTPGRLPAEVGAVPSAVALDAGCYLGQEPVARLHYRGQARRTLRRVTLSGRVPRGLDPTVDPDTHATLAPLLAIVEPPDDGGSPRRGVGELTTWARRPDGSWTGLACVRRELDPGTELRLHRAPELRIDVVDGPDTLAPG